MWVVLLSGWEIKLCDVENVQSFFYLLAGCRWHLYTKTSFITCLVLEKVSKNQTSALICWIGWCWNVPISEGGIHYPNPFISGTISLDLYHVPSMKLSRLCPISPELNLSQENIPYFFSFKLFWHRSNTLSFYGPK